MGLNQYTHMFNNLMRICEGYCVNIEGPTRSHTQWLTRNGGYKLCSTGWLSFRLPHYQWTPLNVCVCFVCLLACLLVCPWSFERPMFLCICWNLSTFPHFRLGIGCNTVEHLFLVVSHIFLPPAPKTREKTLLCPEEWPIVSGWLEIETQPQGWSKKITIFNGQIHFFYGHVP